SFVTLSRATYSTLSNVNVTIPTLILLSFNCNFSFNDLLTFGISCIEQIFAYTFSSNNISTTLLFGSSSHHLLYVLKFFLPLCRGKHQLQLVGFHLYEYSKSPFGPIQLCHGVVYNKYRHSSIMPILIQVFLQLN